MRSALNRIGRGVRPYAPTHIRIQPTIENRISRAAQAIAFTLFTTPQHTPKTLPTVTVLDRLANLVQPR